MQLSVFTIYGIGAKCRCLFVAAWCVQTNFNNYNIYKCMFALIG